MGKIIAIIVIAAVAWFVYSGNIDLNKVKDSSINAVQNDKTFKAVNSNRAENQRAVQELGQ